MRVIHKGGFFVGSYQIYHFIIAKNVCRCNCSALFPGVVAQSAQCGQDGPKGQRREGAHDKAQHQHHRRTVQRHGRGQDDPCAKQLADLIRGMGAHVNLIPINPVDGSPYSATDAANVRRFQQKLESLGVNATVRRRLGSEISAACGQLRRDEMNGKV